MAESTEQENSGPEDGLAEGLGSENTQAGPVGAHPAEPDALEYGLGSPDTQSDANDPGHVAIDHTNDGAASGLPLGLGSDNTQAGPSVPNPAEPDSLEFGLGSADTQDTGH